jgi:hypothetical protein
MLLGHDRIPVSRSSTQSRNDRIDIPKCVSSCVFPLSAVSSARYAGPRDARRVQNRAPLRGVMHCASIVLLCQK